MSAITITSFQEPGVGDDEHSSATKFMRKFSKLTETAASEHHARPLIEIKGCIRDEVIGRTLMSWLSEESHEKPKCRGEWMVGV